MFSDRSWSREEDGTCRRLKRFVQRTDGSMGDGRGGKLAAVLRSGGVPTKWCHPFDSSIVGPSFAAQTYSCTDCWLATCCARGAAHKKDKFDAATWCPTEDHDVPDPLSYVKTNLPDPLETVAVRIFSLHITPGKPSGASQIRFRGVDEFKRGVLYTVSSFRRVVVFIG